MNLHARLGAVLTVGLLILVVNAYVVINGHWDWSFDFESFIQPNTVVELPASRLPERAS